MRPSKRAPDEMRKVTLERGVARYAKGSCLIAFGETKVLCAASLEDRPPPWLRGQGRGRPVVLAALAGAFAHRENDRARSGPNRSGRWRGGLPWLPGGDKRVTPLPRPDGAMRPKHALLGLRLADLDPGEVDPRRSAADLAPETLAAIERLIAERTQARKEKNWPRADEIRAELDTLGVQVTDTPTGPTWQLR